MSGFARRNPDKSYRWKRELLMPTQQRRETDKDAVTIAASLRTNAFFLRQAARSGNVRKLMEEAETVARHLHLLADQFNKGPTPWKDANSSEG